MGEFKISGSASADGNWTRHGVVRETQGGGSISFDPDTIAGSPFTMRLRNAANGEVFSDEVFWAGNDTGRKTLATGVIAHTRFTIDSRGSQGRTAFSGKLDTA